MDTLDPELGDNLNLILIGTARGEHAKSKQDSPAECHRQDKTNI